MVFNGTDGGSPSRHPRIAHPLAPHERARIKLTAAQVRAGSRCHRATAFASARGRRNLSAVKPCLLIDGRHHHGDT